MVLRFVGVHNCTGMLQQPLLDSEAGSKDDALAYVRLFATVLAVSLGSSLQFGFATGSLNNLEQVCTQRDAC